MDWKSKRSTQVLDSSTAECVSLVVVGKENAWLKDVLKELEIFAVNKPTVVMNNTVVIALSGQGTTFVVFRVTIMGGRDIATLVYRVSGSCERTTGSGDGHACY